MSANVEAVPLSDRISYAALLSVLAALTALFFAASLSIGPAGLNLSLVWQGLTGHGEEAAVLIMQEIRLPRAVLAVLIGAALGLCGAALQGLLRNPLAEPGLIGVSACASLGAVLALYTGLSALFPLALPLMGLAGALVGVVLLQVFVGRNSQSLTLILAGVALTSLAGALTSLALNLSPNPFAAMEIVFWMLGSLDDRSMEHVRLAAPLIVGGCLLFIFVGRGLDALSLGRATGRTLGVNVAMIQWLIVMGTAASVGAAVSVSGSIGFIGLIVPHLLRPLTGARPSRLLLASALGGAVLLLAADIAVRIIAPASGLKLGVVTALIGAPFFLWLVLRHRRGNA